MSNVKPIRVGLLMYGLDRPLSGVTRVALEIGKALQGQQEVEVVYLTTYRHGPFRDDPALSSWYLPGCERLPALMALGGPLIAYAAHKLALDIVHDPVGIAPFTIGRRFAPFKRIVTLHDAIAYRFPEGYPWLNNFLHKSYIPCVLGNVDSVITGSQAARADLLRFLSLRPDNVHVVLDGVNALFTPQPQSAIDNVVKKYALTQPFFLAVNAWQPRKNLAGLLSAFAQVHRQFPAHRLVVAGGSLWHTSDLQENLNRLGLQDAIDIPGYIEDEDLPALYSAATLFLFPSFYEGFGLPVLEAMACGTPVICSNTSSLPEVAGDAALLVDPYNPEDIARAIEQALNDAMLYAELTKKGLERVHLFSWERAARATVALYKEVIVSK